MAGSSRKDPMLENLFNKRPYVSFVVCARNDNYGGNFIQRLQMFLDNLCYLCNKYTLKSELIIVEWNPPKENKKLKHEINWLSSEYFKVRFLEVPPILHRKIQNSNKMPIFEYIAKNVGIRRAKGEYILATNPDIIYSKSLIKYLAKKRLKNNAFYRIDRYDVKNIQLDSYDAKSIESNLKNNCIRLNTLGITIKIKNNAPFLRAQNLSLRNAKKKIKEQKKVGIDLVEFNIHTNASGDFLLMRKQNWFKLKAYPEIPTHSFIDSYMCVIAASSGLKQIILPKSLLLFHLEHNRPTANRPLTSYEIFEKESKKMLTIRKPIINNNKHWGLSQFTLKGS